MGAAPSLEQRTNPQVLETLHEEFNLADDSQQGFIDEQQFKHLLIRRVARQKIRKTASAKAGKLASSDVRGGVEPMQAKILADLSSQAFAKISGMNFQQFLNWQKEYDYHSLGIEDGTAWQQAKRTVQAAFCGSVQPPPTGNTEVGEGVYEPVPGGPPETSSAASTSVLAEHGATTDATQSDNQGLTKLERHTKSIKKLRALEKDQPLNF
mmetsp:Transcript_20327/g.49924  ORF Transcript_20327/g.49924 Transcript_20327/m.49924 type:complete len:210 (+) Transcript_20327:192-821(+)